MATKAISPLKGKPLRNPGQSLDEALRDLVEDKGLTYFLVPAFLWLVAALEWFAVVRGIPRQPVVYALVAAVTTAWGAVGIVQVRKRARAMRLGRDGERAVGQYLERLRAKDAQVLHDIPGDNFNLDHVVICDRGIFVVETKTWSKPTPDASIQMRVGALTMNGRPPRRDPIRQVQAQIAWLGRTLEETTGKKWPVQGALVFPGWFVEPELKSAFDGMWVLEPKALPAFIEQEPMRLSQADVHLAKSRLSDLIWAKA
jgi:hypothetical protein